MRDKMATSKPDKILRRIKKLKTARDTIQGEIDSLLEEYKVIANPKRKRIKKLAKPL